MTLVSPWFDSSTEKTRSRLVLVAASLGILFAQIDTSVVNLAVKSIDVDLRAGVSAMQWVIDSYNMVYASLLLTAGTLGDLYGRRRIFALGIILFVAGTLMCALAPNSAVLIGGRIVSGIGAAFEVPMSLVLLTIAYPDRKERSHALGIWASCNGLAFIAGPIIGGWLVSTIGWRSIFYMILPVCAAALALTYAAIRESAEPKNRALDLPGQGLAIAGLAAFTFAAIEGAHRGWTAPAILASLAIATASFAAFVGVEARTHGPLLPLEFFRRRTFSASLAIAGLMTFGMYALLFVMPLYFQTMRGASPLTTGLELLPMSISFFAVSQYVGHLNNRFGPGIVMTAGMACMGIGALALACLGETDKLSMIELAMFVVGIGLGLNTAPVNAVAVAALPPERSGTASGVLNTARMVGATLGVAILGAIFAARAGQQSAAGPEFLAGMQGALAGGGIAELTGALIAALFIRRDSAHQLS